MRIPLSWLQDFLDISDLSTTEIAEKLTMAGLEVESIEALEPPFSGVVVGKVLSCATHPEAERLQVAKVTDGQEEYQVVCGAPNCREGLVTAFAKIGARLTDEEGKVFKIKKGKLRGIESQGMLCSEVELKAGTDHSGIIELNGEFAVGSVYGENLRDTVFDIALTPNLAHCMSVYGVARELSAILGRPLNSIRLASPLEEGAHITDRVEVAIHNQKACPRYGARLVTGVKVGPSPQWMQQRIEAAGMRSVNNVVDMTNYLLLELGHPLHAFDFDKIAGGRIIVRDAEEGERFTTLDDQTHSLKQNDLLICDAERPVALAGVMGGKNSEVSDATQNVLIEAAYFEPRGIGRTARRLNLLTESSSRFERGVDPNRVTDVLDRAAELLRELGGGIIAKGDIDQSAHTFSNKEITVRLSRVCSLLGISLVQGEVQETLERFDFRCEWRDEDHLVVWVPPFRHDLNEEVDLIEEVARIYGYANLPKQAARYRCGKTSHAPQFLFEQEVRRRLISLGLQEIITSDLIGPDMLKEVPQQVAKADEVIRVTNPTSIEQSILRPSLLPGILEVLAHNIRHQTTDLTLFESGTVYSVAEGVRIEQQVVAVVLTGNRMPFYSDEAPQEWDFYDLKGLVEQLVKGLRVSGTSVERSDVDLLHPGRQAALQLGELCCGTFGEVHPALLKHADIKQKVFFAILNLEELLAAREAAPRMQPLPLYPASERDWTLNVTETLSVGEILNAVKAEAPRILENVELRSVYTPKSGGKNVTVRLRYRDSKKTLSQGFVDKQHEALCERVTHRVRETSDKDKRELS